MININNKYSILKDNTENIIIKNGINYLWYISMISLCIIVYIIYSYLDNSTTHIKLLYILALLISSNSYIINILENKKQEKNESINKKEVDKK